jgi:hypothetical protein
MSRNDPLPAEAAPGQTLDALIRRLAEDVAAARREAERQRRRLRLLAGVLVAVLVGAGLGIAPALQDALAQGHGQGPMGNPAELAARRAELVAMLPADKQKELLAFEREVEWLTRYMQTWDPGMAGAVVGIMLFRMAGSMDTMPSMEQQMRTMSAQMGALPAIVAELAQINAKMHVITATMDSTMGRAGRMMPWMPFSP